MEKKFEKRIVREMIVDTRLYRYIAVQRGSCCLIQRLPLAWLDTTAALDGWETVKVIY